MRMDEFNNDQLGISTSFHEISLRKLYLELFTLPWLLAGLVLKMHMYSTCTQYACTGTVQYMSWLRLNRRIEI